MGIHISQSFDDKVCHYTDAGSWKHSWHWKRDANGRITLEGAKQMLDDLDCDGMTDEIHREAEHIRKRYGLAKELKAMIAKAEAEEEADTHVEDCGCNVCVRDGYAKRSD